MPIKFPKLDSVRHHAPALAVLIACCFLTLLAYLSERRHSGERVALHASADAAQFERTLQQGIDSYHHLNRDLAAHVTATAVLTGAQRTEAFDIYTRTADVLREHPGLSYIGYIERIRRTEPALPETPADLADPDYRYPYLYAYPQDARSRHAKGLDFSVAPARWSAMQQARDSGNSVSTAKHTYLTGTAGVPVILVFTPIYDPALPAATVAERRIALRGYVFSIYEIEEMIERVMGSNFHALFDLEIYDGAVRAENILYDGDKRPHVLLHDAEMPIARSSTVTMSGREWQLYFFPKSGYIERYRSWNGLLMLAFGFAVTIALSGMVWRWTMRQRYRARQHADAGLRFDAVFENHPSAMYSLDLKRRFLNANAQALKEFKIGKAELIGRSVEEFVAPDMQALARANFDDTLRGNSVSYDSAIVLDDGSRVDINVIMIPVKSGSRVTSVLGIGQNVTAQKLGEWRLQESRKMLQLVIDHIPQRVFWKDTQFAFLGCNQAFARDAGLASPADIVGRTDFDLPWRAEAQLYRDGDIATIASGQARINYEEPQHRADGSESWLRTSKIPLSDMDGNTVALLGLYEDITDRKAMEHQLRELAHHDALTGLANRAFFHHHLELAVAKSRRDSSLMALMYFDIDHFKAINDSFGHDTGDALLKAFAKRVGDTVREADVFARLGGDEFALLLENLPTPAAAERVGNKLVAAMQAPYRLGERTVTVSSSIGVAFFQRGMRADELIRRADQAMYAAKRGGRNR
ncbi:MAG TPA: diguanylate cyclase, partial [Telluria sp.]|nr:diguanylate cyclase [Telluria sp.]